MAESEFDATAAEVEEVIRNRRSVHDYSDETVADETLRGVFDLARYTPSGYNLQPWEFVVLRSDGDREALAECAHGQEHVVDAPVGVIVLGNTDPAAHADRVFDDWLAKGYLSDEETRDALVEQVREWRDRSEDENRLWTTRSTALAAMTVMYAARSKGLSTCPMEGFDPEAVRERFEIPDRFEPVMLLTMGYPAEGADDREGPRKFRRPVDEIVHVGSFDDSE